MRPVRRLAPALLLLVACEEAPPPAPPDAGFVVREDLQLRWPGGLPRLPQTATVPASWATAAAQWRTATTAFSVGNYPGATQSFLQVADSLRPGDRQPGIDRSMRAARCMAYENAARAFEGHAEPETGIVALVRARVRDPGCKASISDELDRLASATETSSAAR